MSPWWLMRASANAAGGAVQAVPITGALLRARRAMVAGDSHQLPPTSFFVASGGGEDDEELETVDFDPALTSNLESVLDVMRALLPPHNGTRTWDGTIGRGMSA